MGDKTLKEIVDLTSKLISFQTTGDRPRELERCVNFIEGFFQETDLIVKRFGKSGKPSLVINFEKTKVPKVFLNGHIDVVPGEDSQFEPRVSGGRLFGRGTCDMKGQVAAFAVLMRNLSLSGKRRSLGLMVVSDEEIGGFNGSLYLLKRGYKPKFLLSGEPTDLKIGNQAKGIMWLKLVAKGKSGHSARPWEGENAVLKITKAVQKINRHYPAPLKEVWKTTVNLAVIKGGDIPNKIPDQAGAILDIRYIPEDDPKRLLEDLKKLCPEVTFKSALKNNLFEPAAFTPRDNSYILKLKKAIEEVTSYKAEFVNKHAASDVRHFTAADIPAVVFGPNVTGSHTEEEWVDLGSLERFYRVLYKFATAAC